jgi:mono/diheme cytochrome c family protein
MKLKLATVALITVFTLPAFAQNTGAATYASKCQMCHGADGAGTTPAGIKKESTADLIAVTKSGKGKMPAYAGKLTDAEIKDVIAHVRTLQK